MSLINTLDADKLAYDADVRVSCGAAPSAELSRKYLCYDNLGYGFTQLAGLQKKVRSPVF